MTVIPIVIGANAWYARLSLPGAHNPERATAINSCNSVFTSEFIFR